MSYFLCYFSIPLMSLKSLENYLERNPVIQPQTQRNRTFIIVSDSKASRLERCVQNIQPENCTVWECKGGRNSFQAAQFVKANLEYYVSKFGNILLVIWTGYVTLLSSFIGQSLRSIILTAGVKYILT